MFGTRPGFRKTFFSRSLLLSTVAFYLLCGDDLHWTTAKIPGHDQREPASERNPPLERVAGDLEDIGLAMNHGIAPNIADHAHAGAVVRRAFSRLLRARSYVRNQMCECADGKYVQSVLVHFRSDAGKDYFRSETAPFDPVTQERSPVRQLIEISNESGDWEIRDASGIDDIAFLRTDHARPPSSTAIQREFLEWERKASSTASTFVERRGYLDEKAVAIISVADGPEAESKTVYTVEAATGDLLAVSYENNGVHVSERFTINPEIDASAFVIPESKIIAPTEDVDQLSDFLVAHSQD
jgi:hypothetical protein